MLGAVEVLAMLALFVSLDPAAAAPRLPDHLAYPSFRAGVEDLLAASVCRALVLSLAYGAGVVRGASFGAFLACEWAQAGANVAYLAAKLPLFRFRGVGTPALGLEVAMFALSGACALLHLGAGYYAVAHHRRRRAMGLEGLGLPPGGGGLPRPASALRLPGPGARRRSDGAPADPDDLADPDSRFLAVRGVRVHYKLAWPAGGGGAPAEPLPPRPGAPPLPPAPAPAPGPRGPAGRGCTVLLHGFGAGAFAFRRVAQPLADATGRPVLALDRPGFGLTARPPPAADARGSPYAPLAQAALTLEVVSALGFGECVLAGHADGALVALAAAALSARAAGAPGGAGLARAGEGLGGAPPRRGGLSAIGRRLLGGRSEPREIAPPAAAGGGPGGSLPRLVGRALRRAVGARSHDAGQGYAPLRSSEEPTPGGSAAPSGLPSPAGKGRPGGGGGGTPGGFTPPVPVRSQGGDGAALGELGGAGATRAPAHRRQASAGGVHGRGPSGGAGGGPGGEGEAAGPPPGGGGGDAGAGVPAVRALAMLHPCLLGEGVPQFARWMAGWAVGRRALAPLLRSEIGEVGYRRAWHDAGQLTPEVVGRYRAYLHLPGWEAAVVEAVRGLRAEASGALVRECARELRGAGVPTALVAGSDDPVAPAAQVAGMARSLFPAAQVVVLPRCGHLSHEESPGALAAYLAQLAAAGA